MNHPTFKDGQGREWIVAVAIPDIATVRDTCNVDLTEVDGIARIDREPVLAVAVLWILCERQAKSLNVDADGFGRLFDGEMLDDAIRALMGAIENFSRPQRRPMIRKVLEKQQALQEATLRQAEEVLDSDQLDQVILTSTKESLRKSLDSLSGTPSSKSQPSPASTSVVG